MQRQPARSRQRRFEHDTGQAADVLADADRLDSEAQTLASTVAGLASEIARAQSDCNMARTEQLQAARDALH